MVVGVVNGRMMEDIAIIGGLIGVQVLYAGSAMLLGYLMSLGIKSLTIVIFTSFATFLLLLPFAFYYERYFFFVLPIFCSGNFVKMNFMMVWFFNLQEQVA